MNTCESCRFWFWDKFQHLSKHEQQFGDYVGYCRRFPPQFDPNFQQHSDRDEKQPTDDVTESPLVFLFPITEQDSWCGEWQMKPTLLSVETPLQQVQPFIRQHNQYSVVSRTHAMELIGTERFSKFIKDKIIALGPTGFDGFYSWNVAAGMVKEFPGVTK